MKSKRYVMRVTLVAVLVLLASTRLLSQSIQIGIHGPTKVKPSQYQQVVYIGYVIDENGVEIQTHGEWTVSGPTNVNYVEESNFIMVWSFTTTGVLRWSSSAGQYFCQM